MPCLSRCALWDWYFGAVTANAGTRRASGRRAQLLQAALQVIAEDGLEVTTTRRIAAKAGLPLGSLHYAFASKEELICAVIDDVGDKIELLLRHSLGAIALPTDDPEQTLRRLLGEFWNLVEADPAFQIMQYELTLYCLRRPEMRWLAQRQYDRYCAVVAESLDAVTDTALRSGEFARLIVAGVDGIIIQFLVHQDRERAQHDIENLALALRHRAEHQQM